MEVMDKLIDNKLKTIEDSLISTHHSMNSLIKYQVSLENQLLLNSCNEFFNQCNSMRLSNYECLTIMV